MIHAVIDAAMYAIAIAEVIGSAWLVMDILEIPAVEPDGPLTRPQRENSCGPCVPCSAPELSAARRGESAAPGFSIISVSCDEG